MFLWCGCHCANESESTFPPDSIFDASSIPGSLLSYSSEDPARPDPPTGVAVCTACEFGVAPAAYEFEWNYNGELGDMFQPRPCCETYRSQKKYKLYFRGFSPADNRQCAWSSNERVALSNGVACFPNLPDVFSRVTMQTRYNNGAITAVYIHYGYRYNSSLPILHPQQTIVWSSIGYILVKEDGVTPLVLVGDVKIQCLQQLRFAAPWIINPQSQRIWGGTFRPPAGVWDGAPCRQSLFTGWDMGLPEYVTCTPVPA
jgi:hypothetical protein